MAWQKVGDKFDTRVGELTEKITRRMSRRDALRTAVVGGAASIAALAVGQRPAEARALTSCDCGPTYRCGHYGHSCPSYGCPSGYDLCKNGSAYCSCDQGHYNVQGYCCEYSSGSWVACNNGGTCGAGYRLCYDCHCPSGCTYSGCRYWCTCLSACICCNCCTKEQVRAEMKRLQKELAAQK